MGLLFMPALHCIPAKSLFLELWQHQSVLALVTGDQRLFIFSFCTKFGFSCQAIKRPAPWAMQVGPAVKRPRGAITWGVGAVGHMGHMGPVVPVGPGGPVGLPGTWGAMSPFGAGWEPDKALCVVHNKVRSVGSMAQSGIGQWVCLWHLGETFFLFSHSGLPPRFSVQDRSSWCRWSFRFAVCYSQSHQGSKLPGSRNRLCFSCFLGDKPVWDQMAFTDANLVESAR